MSRHDAAPTSTRRRYLAGVAAAGVAGLAGCGDSSGNGTATTLDPDEAGEPVTTAENGLLPAPTLGPEDAPVTVMAFEDYACPHCRDYSLETFPDIRSEYIDAGDVRYEFHDLPIPVNQESQRAASAARAVQDTVGNGAFWAYSKSLFENQSDLGPSKYADLASPVGADPDTVRTAAVERSYQATVQADRQRGVDLGISGTPGIVVNGSILEGYSYETVSSAIDDAL